MMLEEDGELVVFAGDEGLVVLDDEAEFAMGTREILLFAKVTAPISEKSLPSTEAPAPAVIAASVRTVPLKTDPAPSVTAPVVCQYTLSADPPLIT